MLCIYAEFSQGMVLPTQNTTNVSQSKSLKPVTPPQQRQVLYNINCLFILSL